MHRKLPDDLGREVEPRTVWWGTRLEPNETFRAEEAGVVVSRRLGNTRLVKEGSFRKHYRGGCGAPIYG
jgi:hypothetical protein